MKLNRYAEQLQAQMGEAGAGAIPIRVSYEDYDVDGKFVAFGSSNHITIEHTTQTTFVAYDGTNDGGIRKVTDIQFYNSDAANTRTVRFYLDRRSGSATLFLKATLEVGGSAAYKPETGWTVYDANGQAGGDYIVASAHAASHKSGGSDVLLLDEFGDPSGSVEFAQQQALQFRVENRTSDPASPAVGQLWIRTDL